MMDTCSAKEGTYRGEYAEWKGWAEDTFGDLGVRERRYYDAELARTRLGLDKGPLRVLEIGFGNGQFLSYAKSRGWQVAGTEVNASLVEYAQRRGFEAILSASLSPLQSGAFDLVVAFDVMEHVEHNLMLDFVGEALRVLRPGGVFLARVPNGDSPFGLLNQNSDITHVSMIGSGKFRYLAGRLGATVVFIGGEAEPVLTGEIRKTLYRVVAIPLRKAINCAIRLIFFPHTKVPFCSLNLVAILRRKDESVL